MITDAKGVTSILKLKIGRPLNMPAKRLAELLEQGRRDCCRARNATVTHWLLWRKQRPDWKPGDPYDAPEAKIKRKPADPAKPPPKDSPIGPRLFLSRELYEVATRTAVNLSATVASSCVQEVVDRLKSNTPYNHDGDARWNWQAILNAEVSLPTWRGGTIPSPKQTATFTYNDHECTLRFPLLSKSSGYATISPTVRLEVGDMSAGHRRLLQRIASGEIRMADSNICERDGKWYFNLCYTVPTVVSGLDTERVLTVYPTLPDEKWPFVVTWPTEGTETARWYIGKAKPIVADYRRVVARRRAIRYRYSDGTGSGHGKQRWYQTIKPMARYVVDMQARFEKLTCSDIVKLALREKCGTILYREPTMPVRDNSWWAKQDVPFNWTSFDARLRHAVTKAGLQYEVERIRMGEWRPKEQKSAS